MEEDKSLLEFATLSGKKSWMKIGSEFGNRSDVRCHCHYLQLQRGEPKSLLQFEFRSRVIPTSLCVRPPARTWPSALAVLPILHLSIDEPVDSLADMRIFKFTDDFPIQLITSLDLKKSDPLFDSDI
jgi:hypothetical protein